MDENFIVKGTCMYVKLPQDLDCNNAALIRSEADKIMERENIRTIIFDFEKTNFMDSTGIGVIMGRYKNVKLIGGSVLAINVNAAVEKILTLSGIHKLIRINEVSGLKMPVK
ncbi:STAS domain-containing protein [Konateibacter massiliensis]|uniref:STAS domain-containing protein n=1 Tax=Konateibacter massiliensis TaxID=2002841 RepID=UPI000C14E299|nr:anti-sigma factor antagonist [Konateibacter massiliensis]